MPEITVTGTQSGFGAYIGQKISDAGTSIASGWNTFTNWVSGSSSSSVNSVSGDVSRIPASTTNTAPTTGTPVRPDIRPMDRGMNR